VEDNLKKVFIRALTVFLLIFAISFPPAVNASETAIDRIFSKKDISKKRIESKAVFNEEYPETLLYLINNAKESVLMAHYSFNTETKTAGKIADALIAASKRGVKVSILLNGGKSGVGPKNLATMKKLGKSGIKIDIAVGKRVLHAKLIVADSLWTLAGSTNLTETSMIKNNESNLLIHSADIAATFEKYIEELHKNADQDINLKSNEGAGIKALTDRNFIDCALDLINGASKEICITTYLFSYDIKNAGSNNAKLFAALIAAHKRGVGIRAFIEQSSIAFNEHIHSANMRTSETLMKEGIKGIRFDTPETITHSKIIIADGQKALLGSTNLYKHDIDSAHQVNFYITNAALLDQIGAYFEKLYAKGVAYEQAWRKKQ